MEIKSYDVIIIGGGPAGLAAIIYARRAALSVLLIEKSGTGGAIALTAEVENYPGGMEGESGADLAARMSEQAEHFGYYKVSGEVVSVDLHGDLKTVHTKTESFTGKSVIIATGCVPQLLGVPGESEFTGRGVSYCATCDAPFFRNLQVYVVGGGNSAVEESIHLAKFAKKVTIIHRRDELRADVAIQNKAKEISNIAFLFDTVVKEIKGSNMLNGLTLENVKTGVISEISAPANDGMMGVFMFVGQIPQTGIFKDILDMEKGYITTGEDMSTNISGVYAAGDIRKKELRQVVTAAADGAIAAHSIAKYIEGL